MPAQGSFADLIARLRASDEEAAARVFRQFAGRLIGLARTHLDTALRRKVDPEDVAQSVFRSFFRRQADKPYDLENWDSLWSLLALITVRKCCDRAEEFHAACRDVGREVPAAASPNSSAGGWEAFARDPTPVEAVLLTETVERLLHRLDDRDRQIAVLGLQGYAIPEISAQVGCAERTVYRVLGHIKEILQAMQAEDTDRP